MSQDQRNALRAEVERGYKLDPYTALGVNLAKHEMPMPPGGWPRGEEGERTTKDGVPYVYLAGAWRRIANSED